MDCKRALQDTGGELGKAEDLLVAQGVAAAAKKASRTTNEGLVESYVHTGGRIGALVEVNCETDFVARTHEFKQLAHDLAMQIAAMAPLSVDCKDDSHTGVEKPEGACLMHQTYIKDPTKTIHDLVNEAVTSTGENVRVRRFTRYSLGE